jgi:hypothetical protein
MVNELWICQVPEQVRQTLEVRRSYGLVVALCLLIELSSEVFTPRQPEAPRPAIDHRQYIVRNIAN